MEWIYIWNWVGRLLLAYLVYGIITTIHDAFFGPLSNFPGPRLRASSSLPEVITLLRGEEGIVYPLLHEKYGPIVRVTPNRLSFIGPQAFKDIYGPKSRAQKDPFFYGKPHTGVNPIVNAGDATHSRQRKALSAPFSAKSLRDLEPRLQFWVKRLIDRLDAASETGGACDIVELYNCCTFDIMGDLIFSEDLGMLSNGKYATWLKATFEGIKAASRIVAIKMISSYVEAFIGCLLDILPKLRGREQMEHWDSSTARMRRRLQKTPGQPDMWSKVLERAPSAELSEGEHLANSAFFIFAGSETTATALSAVTYCLLKHPECLEKLMGELRGSFSHYDDSNMDSLVPLRYLQAVLQEGLRMCPPVPSMLARKVPDQGAIICGKQVPGGTTVGVHHLSSYRYSKFWTDADVFRPERWLDDERHQNDCLDAFEPFSVGTADCLGKPLAWHEMRLILTAVLLHFDLELCSASASWLDDLRIFGLWEKKPLTCRVKRNSR